MKTWKILPTIRRKNKFNKKILISFEELNNIVNFLFRPSSSSKKPPNFDNLPSLDGVINYDISSVKRYVDNLKEIE